MTTRLAAVAALAAIAVVHVVDGLASLSDVAYVGGLELSLSAACVLLIGVLLVHATPLTWKATGALMAVAAMTFLASRTVGLPDATDDVGNWGPSSGIASLAVEVVLVLMAARAGVRFGRRPRSSVDRAPLS